eukprot:TRINITY_DN2833_c0_g1_i1.p1 TRINITY_DN2833_c0_g1~~TRINITY_DN2833_c0_g1_i1.p1  ORF type:complete len:566 (+),score=198.73 TRINITY_DN2833_c0_g1_i1:67-1764(+)
MACDCCTPIRRALIFAFVGVILIVCGIVLPLVIKHEIRAQVCDELCVPKESDPAWKINNWLSNYNASMHPPEYYSFYIYNISNVDQILTGAKPVVSEVGPYVYRVWKEKYAVERQNGDELVAYELQTRYEFEPTLSPKLNPTDKFVTINLPFVAANQVFYSTLGSMLQPTLIGQCSMNPLGTQNQACLFSLLSANEILFSQYSFDSFLANLIFYNAQPRLDTQFRLFFNCSSAAECREVNKRNHWFGMGGSCTPTATNPNLPLHQCNAPGVDNNNTKWVQYTGRTDINQLGQLFSFLGNKSIDSYRPGQPEVVRGTDRYNFAPLLSNDDTLTIWEDFLLRSIDLTYDTDVTVQDIKAFRYRPVASLFDGTDVRNQMGQPVPRGFLNVTRVPEIRNGEPAATFASMPHFYDADPAVRDQVVCSNCPKVLDKDRHVSYIDVQPIIGSVLNGAMFGQLNVRLGQDFIYGNTSQYDPNLMPYAKMQDVYMPVMWYEYSSTLTADIATNILKPKLSQAETAATASKVILYVGTILGGFMLLISILFYVKLRMFSPQISDSGMYREIPDKH